MESNPAQLHRLPADSVALVGVPWDENSSYLRGSADAPTQIRGAFHSGASNQCAENGIDLSAESRFIDVGDLKLGKGLDVLSEIEMGITALLEQRARVLSLGGDHAITLPIVRAFARQYKGLQILHLDAHPDLYDEFEGNRYSHACPFARIMEEGLAIHLVQVGIRTMNPHQRLQAERFGVDVIEAKQLSAARDPWTPDLEGPIYLSLDLDVLDPAFAPGVSHHEPGGLSTRDVLGILQRMPRSVVGADVVELNPARDPSGITTMAAVKFMKEIAAHMLAG